MRHQVGNQIVNKTLVYEFLPPNKPDDFYILCRTFMISQSSKNLLRDKTPFIDNSLTNFYILRKNPELINEFGIPEDYLHDQEDNDRYNLINSDFIQGQDSLNKYCYGSDHFYALKGVDRVFIIFNFEGKVNEYKNIEYKGYADIESGPILDFYRQKNCWITNSDIENNFYVHSETSKLSPLSKDQIRSLSLSPIEDLKQICTPNYE
ncbi:MAG: hypothetical protein AAFY45_35060 [Bacteroidota bacterium]